MVIRYTILFLFILMVVSAFAQDLPDSTRISIPSDSIKTIIDSTLDSLLVDTADGYDFDQRYNDFKETQEKRLPSFSFFDSLISWYTSPRLNMGTQVKRSLYHDAGDYFRSDPSFFIVEHQLTPMRKTVQPFGLTGGRLNYLTGDIRMTPFEHVPEPDGLLDMNDVPTGLDHNIYILEGPAGQIFGGQDAVASIITLPQKPSDYQSESAIKADKGAFGYAYTRGKYSKHFQSGRKLDMSIEYRTTEGDGINRNDDTYHYFANTFFPIKSRSGLRVFGYLYDREGRLGYQQDLTGRSIIRERFDRNLMVSYDNLNDSATRRWEFGYKHTRNGSYVSSSYKSRLNLTGHGIFTSREWMLGSAAVQVDASADYLEYDQGYGKFIERYGEMFFSWAQLSDGLRLAARLGGRYDYVYHALPAATVLAFYESPLSLFTASLGYSKRAPSLNELYLPAQVDYLYGTSEQPYRESGNPDLQSEKQLVGNLLYEWGSVTNALTLTITGGKINDAIEWESDRSGSEALFSPINTNLDFLNLAFKQKFSMGDVLGFKGGGSYHYIEYENFTTHPYQPEYQFFSGMELHHYWESKLMHLYAYGEITYTGPYEGYDNKFLGEDLVMNVKLSFSIKDFRFHWVWQNMLQHNYQSREYTVIPGRYTYYGITWDFID